MKAKILAAFDAAKYSQSSSTYAIEIARATNATLVGIFVQDMRYVNFAYAYAWDQPYVDVGAVETMRVEDKEQIEQNITAFRKACEENNINFKVHLNKGVPLQELLHESIFADLIIIDSHINFFSFGESSPHPFLRDLLVDAYCPVLIAPHQYTFFDNIVICYDGAPSSVYATKMFSYIFPTFTDLPTTVISVNKESKNQLVEGADYKDLLQLHYKYPEIKILHGNPEEELIGFLKQSGKNSIVIMGAYGRNALSRMFHQSLANRVITEVNSPVFITHH